MTTQQLENQCITLVSMLNIVSNEAMKLLTEVQKMRIREEAKQAAEIAASLQEAAEAVQIMEAAQ